MWQNSLHLLRVELYVGQSYEARRLHLNSPLAPFWAPLLGLPSAGTTLNSRCKVRWEGSCSASSAQPAAGKLLWPPSCHQGPRAAAWTCQPCPKHSHSSGAQLRFLCPRGKGSGLGPRRLTLVCQVKYRLRMRPEARSLICLSLGILWKGVVVLP